MNNIRIVRQRNGRFALSVALISSGLFSMGMAACPSAPTPPPELPPIALVPEAYWAEAEGTVTVDEMTVPGRLRMNYLVHDDGEVVIPNLVVWVGDTDLVVSLLWWEARREPLRCTTFQIEQALHGSIQGNELMIPPGAKINGRSYFKRDSRGKCVGTPRLLRVESPEVIRVTHQPEVNLFAFDAEFESSNGDHAFTVAVNAVGRFLNRPPTAALETFGRGIETGEGGCPAAMEKGDPPIVYANSPKGLELMLRSTSYDLDGVWPGEDRPKRLRVDLSFEQWAASRNGEFRFLGTDQEIGPVLFETGQEHQILLWVTDRRGAEARKYCRFQVVEPR